jgi:hypothetical protein
MSMIKVIQPQSQDFSEPVASLIKVSSRGIIGNDKSDLVKRAGAEFAHKLENIKFAKDEVPVHLIAIGATEDYGPNRNGDGFKRACCEKYHDTFTKFARFYRDHLNKNPAKSYGLVKASAYHAPMKRIELVVALNGTKEAAERNGGLVADKELEKLARGDDIGVSMACTIPFDVCSSCGNQAKTRAEYCDAIENGGHCKAGGLRHNMGRCLSDGHVLHADNPNPKFFDISHVFRPADRIAYISGTLNKVAAAGIISGAELAERMGISAPTGLNVDPNINSRVREQLIALEKLAEAEQFSNSADALRQALLAQSAAVQTPLNPAEFENIKLAEALRALVDAGVILSLPDFLALTVKTAGAELTHAVAQALPGVFSKIAESADTVLRLEQNSYNSAYAASPVARIWAEKVAITRSILPRDVEKRAYLAVLRDIELPAKINASAQQLTKTAATSTPAVNALAQHYAMYKIAAFADFMKKYDADGLTAPYCVMQNYIM